MEGPEDPEERIDAICASVGRLAAYEPECVLCLSGPLGDHSEDEGRAIVADGLRRAAAAAREAGVRLAFEPIHPSQHDTAGFVCTLDDAVALLDENGLEDVGIMADTYNLVREGPERLATVADRIVGVHVADELPEPAPGVRMLPKADGPSAAIVDALHRAGWDGTVDVEIFSTPDAFWALTPGDAARDAYASARRLQA